MAAALPHLFGTRSFSATRLVGPISLLLVAALAWSVAELTWQLLPGPEGIGVVPVRPAAARVVGAERPGLNDVARLNLFGRADAPTETAVAAPIEAPVTRLNLTLRGVIASSHKAEARAIVFAPGAEEKHYRIGDSLPGGAVLEEVLRDRVILNRGGRLEALYLPKESDTGMNAVSLPVTGNSSDGTTMEQPAVRVIDSASGERLQSFREQIIANPQQAFQFARVQPVMDNGRLKGYSLTPANDQGLFKELGLVPGDVVTSVNGVSLDDPSKMGELMTQLSTSGELSVVVERGGREEHISVSFGP